MACGALWENGRAKILPIAGIALAILDAVLFIVGIWLETASEEYWKFSASVGLVAAATAHACLLWLAKLAPRFAWSRIAAWITAYSLAVLFIYIIYFTPKGDAIIRVIGVASIVLAALTILTPVFHRLSRGDLNQPQTNLISATRQLHATITCPRCGASLPNSLVETKCDRCGCAFVLKLLDENQPQEVDTST